MSGNLTNRNVCVDSIDPNSENMNLINSSPAHSGDDFKINGSWISICHTFFALSAFLSALIIGSYLHFHKIVQNEHYGYPDEWFPSVSASIGDRYPERNVFQILIALTAPFRLLLLLLWFYTTSKSKYSTKSTKSPTILLWIGFIRTVTCGGWVYVTSGDDHDIHDIMMISYIILTLPYMLISISSGQSLTTLSKTNPSAAIKATKYRKLFFGLFFGVIIPLLYFFIQHKVHKVAGAYSIYALQEWLLIILDVMFDGVSIYEFSALELSISTNSGLSKSH